jgi:RimJ/RimL family protein N-acetyltransferase
MKENILTTERLSMRPFAESDLDWLVRHRSNGDVSKFLGGSELQTPSFVLKRLRFYMDCFERLGFAMCLTSWNETGKPIGVTGIQPLEKTGDVEVGYSFEKEFWGKGLATEAAAAWMEYGFTVAGLERIVAVAEPENTGSTKVMEKLGMEFEKTSLSYGLQVVQYAVSKEAFLNRAPIL